MANDNESGPQLYCPVNIEEFLGGKAVPFQIYIKLSEHKFIRLANPGDSLDLERLAQYKQHDLHWLYLRQEDYFTFLGVKTDTSLQGNAEAQDAIKELTHVGSGVMELLAFNGVNDITFGAAQTFVETTLAALSASEQGLSVLASLARYSNRLYQHSVGVSLYSTMVARELNWQSTNTFWNIAIGGLFHDVGWVGLDLSLMSKRLNQLSQAERAVVESHCERGKLALKDISLVNHDAFEIIMQHHENNMSNGYPAKLARNAVHPMAKVIHVVDTFLEQVFPASGGKSIKPEAALEELRRSDNYSSEMVLALAKCFNFK